MKEKERREKEKKLEVRKECEHKLKECSICHLGKKKKIKDES